MWHNLYVIREHVTWCRNSEENWLWKSIRWLACSERWNQTEHLWCDVGVTLRKKQSNFRMLHMTTQVDLCHWCKDCLDGTDLRMKLFSCDTRPLEGNFVDVRHEMMVPRPIRSKRIFFLIAFHGELFSLLHLNVEIFSSTVSLITRITGLDLIFNTPKCRLIKGVCYHFAQGIWPMRFSRYI